VAFPSPLEMLHGSTQILSQGSEGNRPGAVGTYLLDFGHISDEYLITDQRQQFLQLAQVSQEAFPNSLGNVNGTYDFCSPCLGLHQAVLCVAPHLCFPWDLYASLGPHSIPFSGQLIPIATWSHGWSPAFSIMRLELTPWWCC
jgi:hypothetical protein